MALRDIKVKGVPKMTARVGQDAPDFELSSFIAGKGFQPVKLSDYKGKWSENKPCCF